MEAWRGGWLYKMVSGKGRDGFRQAPSGYFKGALSIFSDLQEIKEYKRMTGERGASLAATGSAAAKPV